jgi:hypothetical protein
MSRVTIGSAAYKITADTSGLTEGVAITRREIGQANRILEQTKPAAQKLEEQMQLLEKAFNAGSISADRYNQSMATLAQRKNMLATQTGQLASALRQLPLGDTANQALNLASQLQAAAMAGKAFMASVGGFATLGAGLAFAGIIAIIEQAKRHAEEMQNIEDARARANISAEEKLAKSARKRFDQDLKMLAMINDEQQKINHLNEMAANLENEATRGVERRHKLVAEEAAVKARIREISELEAASQGNLPQQLATERMQLRTRLKGIKEETEQIDATNKELEKQKEILEDLQEVDEERQKKTKEIERQNQFLRDQSTLQEQLARLEAEAAGVDLDRQRSLEGLTDERRAELQALYDQIDAQTELNRKHKEMVDGIKDSIKEHEKTTEEMQKQAEAIKDRLDPTREFERRMAGIEQMGMQGMLSPDEVAAAIAEAVSDHLRTMERDKQSAQMIDRNTMAHIQFIQKMETEAEKRDKQRLAIEQRQTEILGNIAASNQAQADALAGLGLL